MYSSARFCRGARDALLAIREKGRKRKEHFCFPSVENVGEAKNETMSPSKILWRENRGRRRNYAWWTPAGREVSVDPLQTLGTDNDYSDG